MYADYWNLTDTPFRTEPDPRWFVETPGHGEALARLLFVIENRRRCGVLTGPSGVGKSITLEVLAKQVRRRPGSVAAVNLLGKTVHELLVDVAGELGLAPATRHSTAHLWRDVEDFLRGSHATRSATVLIFDHADQAAPECLTALGRLAQLGSFGHAAVTLIVGVDSQSPSHITRWLRDIADVPVELSHLDHDDAIAYVQSLLAKAGNASQIFDPAALDRLSQLSRGNPRELNRLCELSLLAAMAAGDTQVDEATVESVAREFTPARTPQRSNRSALVPVASVS
jgi:type II secretory pathway predicted ATPase ExeA